MKRGFLNTPRSKRVIEEAYAPQPPPGPELSPQGKLHSPTRRIGGDNAMNATMTAIENASNAGNRVVPVRATRTTEPEGEAKLPSLDDDNGAKAESRSKDSKGKGKEKAVDADMDKSSDDTTELPRMYVPRRQGWGRDPDEAFFHIVPKSHGGPELKRAVFRLWPRDPKGKVLMPIERIRGALSPDGYPWGATLYDFYYVRRIPEIPNAMTVMTGSALCEAMKELGELEVAAPEIEWAEKEGKPRVEGAASTEELIQCIEFRLNLGSFSEYSMHDDVRKMASKYEEDPVDKAEGEGNENGEHDEEHNMEDVEQAPEDHDGDENENEDEDHDEEEHEDENDDDDDEMKVDSASIPPPPTIPITSPFHPSHYPKPWPFIPIENPLSILLQERIPLYLLPQTLYVHDPFGLLSVREQSFSKTSWMSRPDIVRTYNLKFSGSVGKEVGEARRQVEEVEEFKARTLIVMRYKRTKEQIKKREPIIEVPLPPYSRRLTKVEDSHLYISPVARVGQGHHSIVYKGEWEVPRDIFIKPKRCQLCFEEDVEKEIQRLKDTGRWEKLRAAASGLAEQTQAELDQINDPIQLDKDGEIIEREIICTIPPDASPLNICDTIDERNLWDRFMEQKKNMNTLHLSFVEEGGKDDSMEGFNSSVIRVSPPFSHGTQRTCTHNLRGHAKPRTTKFTVVAKLSIENDCHLVREGCNYQQFPERFFHHYNGYQAISQLHTIVPVNAIVPQFYGFYTPKKDKANNGRQEEYLSPILLLEHCGEPIDPEKLLLEDQQECASLLLRFQRAGWLHESVAPRNFLVQRGKPTEFPLHRQQNPELSFRLIDFGRSKKFETAEEKRLEEMEAMRMFTELFGSMNVTLSI